MTASTIVPRTTLALPQDRPATWTERTLRKAVCSSLKRITSGHLRVIEGDQEQSFGVEGDQSVTVTVHDPRFWTAMALGGSVGAGSSYTNGYWDCDDLTGLVRLLCRNEQAIAGINGGLNLIAKPVRAFLHYLQRNTVEGSMRNIHAHYDIGNSLFERMLDETMCYSAGLFPTADTDLAQAQVAKMERMCRHIRLESTDHLLEIGTGWGGFAIHAAKRYGCQVTTVTISDEQYKVAKERVAEAGLEDQIRVLLKDYRHIEGRYDKIVSIEMIEAVGHQFYGRFFEKCRSLLKSTGVMALQAITIPEQYYHKAKHEVDFIKRFIFPGCTIPSVSALNGAAERHGLELVHHEDHTPHYAHTLRRWRENCQTHSQELAALGFDRSFRRMWDFYLCYCEGGFAERTIGSRHLVYAGSDWRHPRQNELGY